jgi:AcrR family transcriptional regulator
MRKRLKPARRRELILNAAVALSLRGDYQKVTREAIANHSNVAPRLVSYYFGTMAAVRNAVMTEAVERELLPIIAQGLVAKDPLAAAAPIKLKARALDSIGA